MGQAKLCDLCICCIQCGLAPAWPCLVSEGCHCLVVSNPMKWKIDNKGFQLLLSLPQLFGCCSDDRIHSCPTQIHKVTVISGTQNLGGEVDTGIGNHMTKKNCLSIVAVWFWKEGVCIIHDGLINVLHWKRQITWLKTSQWQKPNTFISSCVWGKAVHVQ